MRLRGKSTWRRLAPVAVALGAVGTALVLLLGGGDGDRARGQPATASTSAGTFRDSEENQAYPEPASSGPTPLAATPSEVASNAAAYQDTGPSPGAPSDAEVRRELRQLQRYRRQARAGGAIALRRNGRAEAPAGSPS